MINSYQIYKDIIDKYMYELSFNAFKIVVELCRSCNSMKGRK